MTVKSLGVRVIITIIILVGLFYLPAPAFSQQTSNIQNLVTNGDFEAGFDAGRGVGSGWQTFSNGSALVSWQPDTWAKVVPQGETAQMIEIKNGLTLDRYAGIYQTIPVVAGEQYRLTLKGLIRSTEGSIEESNYGYRLQYAIDQSGGSSWELVSPDAWQEMPWDEQPLADPESQNYEFDTFNVTITAQSDQVTLFIRGWKKWVDEGSGLFNIDEVSLIGPTPNVFAPPSAQTAVLEEAAPATEGEAVASNDDTVAEVTENVEEAEVDTVTSSDNDLVELPADETETTTTQPDTVETAVEEPDNVSEPVTDAENVVEETNTPAELPLSGQGDDFSINFAMIAGGFVLLILLMSAMFGVLRQRQSY